MAAHGAKTCGRGRFALPLAAINNFRAYVYGNSMDHATGRLLFRVRDGKLLKRYGHINPWAQEILREIDPGSTAEKDQ